jgi:hypothetical protein
MFADDSLNNYSTVVNIVYIAAAMHILTLFVTKIYILKLQVMRYNGENKIVLRQRRNSIIINRKLT